MTTNPTAPRCRFVAALAVGFVALTVAPAMADDDELTALIQEALRTPTFPSEMGRGSEAIESGAPPASGAGSAGSTSTGAGTDTDPGGSGTTGGGETVGPAPKAPANGRTCVAQSGGKVCSTYRAGSLVKRCVRDGRVRTCTFFASDGTATRRCTFQGGRRRCTRSAAGPVLQLGEQLGSVSSDDSSPHTLESSLSWQGWPQTAMGTVGKIVAVTATGFSSCSGTVVSRTLVLTAAHCLYGAGGYHSRIVFVPGMTWDDPADPASVKTPYGKWEANNWWVPNGYRSGDDALDFGLVEFGPRNGSYIGDVVGSWRITTGIHWNAGARTYLVGYPAAGFWEGADGHHGRGQYACDSLYDGDYSRIDTGYELWVKCTMNGGASGGPWFVLLSDDTWTIGGVNDRCYGPNMDDPDSYCQPYSYYLRASYLDARFIEFWGSVNGQLAW